MKTDVSRVGMVARAVALAALGALTLLLGCGGTGLKVSAPAKLGPEHKTIVVKTTAESSIEPGFLVEFENRIMLGLAQIGRFEKVDGSLGRTPTDADVRLELNVSGGSALLVASATANVKGQLIESKTGKVIGSFEAKGKTSSQGGGMREALTAAVNEVVTYVQSADSGGAAGPARTELAGKWAGNQSVGNEKWVESIKEELELQPSGTFVLHQETKYSSDERAYISHRGCTRKLDLRGLWKDHGKEFGRGNFLQLMAQEAKESKEGCFKASYNEPPKPPELDQSKAYEYRFVGSTLMLGKGDNAHSLHPR